MAFALKGTVILAMAWMLAAMMSRRYSAAARHLVWTGALASVATLPLLTVSLPTWQAPIEAPPGLVFQVSGQAAQTPGVAAPVAAANAVAATAIQWRRPVAWIWGAGAVIMLLSIVVAYVRMALRRSAADPFVAEELPSCSANLLRAEAGSMPMTFGVLHPVVFLPADAAQWTAERRKAVLLHELAHVRRGDVLTQLIARIALALHWWNPLAWKAWHEFLKERERAADDLVLTTGARPSDYAGHLLDIAANAMRMPASASVAVAMARQHHFEDRLTAILDSSIQRTAPARAWALGALLLAAPLAAFQVVQADVDGVIRAATSQGNPAILDEVANAALESRDLDAAKKLLEASLALKKNPVDQGLTLFRLGVIEARRDRNAEAEAYYSKAAEAFGNSPQAARALIKLGAAAVGRKEYGRAFELFEKARQLDSNSAAQAAMWMGVLRRAEGDPTQAERYFRDAMALQDAKSQDAVTIGRVYSQFLHSQGRDAEATELDARVSVLRTQTATPGKPAAAGVLRVGGGVKSPSLIEKVEPKYSDEARAAKLTGTTVLSVEIHPDGRARNAQILRPLGLGLDDRAVEAVSQWKFSPATKDGQPVTVTATIEVNWKLL